MIEKTEREFLIVMLQTIPELAVTSSTSKALQANVIEFRALVL